MLFAAPPSTRWIRNNSAIAARRSVAVVRSSTANADSTNNLGTDTPWAAASCNSTASSSGVTFTWWA